MGWGIALRRSGADGRLTGYCPVVLLLLLGACTKDVPSDRPVLDDSVPSADDSSPAARPKLVLWLTIDTLNERYLGHYEDRDTTPNLDELFRQSTVFENTYVAQGITIVSLPTIATGTYPRTHRIRSIEDQEDSPVPMVQTVLGDEGWTTWAYSSNFCLPVQNEGWDKTFCSAPGQSEADYKDDKERDQALIDQLASDLDARPDGPLFIWLHMRDPHITYTPRSPWIEQFWTGDPMTPMALADVDPYILGEAEITDELVDWVDAVYASQVASSDAMVGQVIQGLKARGLYEEAVVVTGTDHGEELGWHNDYWYHGCSMYEGVLNTTWSVRVPGGSAHTVDQAVHTVDMLPTTLDLVGVDTDVPFDGRSLAPAVRGQSLESKAVFFERGKYSAGVAMDNVKYWRRAGNEYSECWPYQNVQLTWTEDAVALYDTVADPREETNLVDTRDTTVEHTALCTWITKSPWRTPDTDLENPLVQECVEYLPAD